MYLVTGAAGFLGSKVVNCLLSSGKETIIVDNLAWGDKKKFASHAKHSACHGEILDITDKSQLEAVFSKYRPQFVIHLAALHYIPFAVKQPSQTLEINVVGTEIVLNAACTHGAQHFFFASSGDVYKRSRYSHRETDDLESDNIYGLSKIQGELLVDLYARSHPGITFTIGRLFNLYGEGETNPHIIPEAIRQLTTNGHLRLGDLSAIRDFTPVEDAAMAIFELTENVRSGVRTVNIGSGVGASVARVVEILCEQFDYENPVILDARKLRKNDRPKLIADTSKLRRILGWIPSENIESRLKNLVLASIENPNF